MTDTAPVDAIDAAFAAQEAPVTETPEIEAQTQADELDGSDDRAESQKSDDVAIPKKILNAMSHKDRRIGKLTAKQYEAEAKIRQLEEQLAKYNTPSESTKSTSQKAEEYDNYEDYLKALAEHKVNEKMQENEKKRLTEQSQYAQAERHNERVTHLEQNDVAAKESFSDYDMVFKEHEDIIADAPEHIKLAFLEAENPAYAFYALAKEGKLESLLSMSPYQVVSTIARYEDKALSLAQQKTVTKAPPPISSVKGSASGKKSLNSLSARELAKWVES